MPINHTLKGDGFVLVGHVTLKLPSTFKIVFDKRPEAQCWSPTIYAFQIGGEVVRIGKTEHVLCSRIEQWNRDVSRALAGDFKIGGTNPWEAFEWRKRLRKKNGEFLAKKFVPPDKEQLRRSERSLIGCYDPPLCNDSLCALQRPSKARSVRNVSAAKRYWHELNSS